MIVIDNDLRTINIPSDIQLLGVVGDRDVNILEFEMPRKYRSIDLSEYTVQIVYKNIERGGLRHIDGQYNPPDVISSDNNINFYWEIGDDACKYPGITEFSIRLKKESGSSFNTRWASLPVLRKQIPPQGKVKDAEVLEVVLSGVEFTVEDEILNVSDKEV